VGENVEIRRLVPKDEVVRDCRVKFNPCTAEGMTRIGFAGRRQ
jgi:hypothetical protein